jgi:tetraacyldisaccharide 4'-kinase
LNPLSSIFRAVVQARNALYDRGVFPAHTLAGPVISVGNLSLGGAGKTPFVILLGEWLKSRAIGFDVLSRGYGRKTGDTLLVNPAGSSLEFGDEPLLMARRLGVPVIVGANRYRAGLWAEEKFGPQLHLLDDGFQHRSLARDFDIVLVSCEDAEDALLPAGRLREPPGSVARADVVVFTNQTGADEKRVLTPFAGPSVWRVRRGIVSGHVPVRPVAFCGIAKPRNFITQLRESGVEPAAVRFYRDHHAYGDRDIRRLLRLRDESGAGGFVTTEKDGVNLGQHFSQLQPLAVVSVTMELENANNALDAMLRMIEERKQRA